MPWTSFLYVKISAMNLYKEIFGKLERAKIDYVIVGGVAVNLYGYARFTGDIDILLALNIENLNKMDKLMKSIGYSERQPVPIRDLSDSKLLDKHLKDKGMRAFTYVSSDMPQLDVDVIIEESKNFEKFKEHGNLIEVWDMKLPVVSIDDLICMKKKTGREKDIADAAALLKLKEL